MAKKYVMGPALGVGGNYYYRPHSNYGPGLDLLLRNMLLLVFVFGLLIIGVSSLSDAAVRGNVLVYRVINGETDITNSTYCPTKDYCVAKPEKRGDDPLCYPNGARFKTTSYYCWGGIYGWVKNSNAFPVSRESGVKVYRYINGVKDTRTYDYCNDASYCVAKKKKAGTNSKCYQKGSQYETTGWYCNGNNYGWVKQSTPDFEESPPTDNNYKTSYYTTTGSVKVYRKVNGVRYPQYAYCKSSDSCVDSSGECYDINQIHKTATNYYCKSATEGWVQQTQETYDYGSTYPYNNDYNTGSSSYAVYSNNNVNVGLSPNGNGGVRVTAIGSGTIPINNNKIKITLDATASRDFCLNKNLCNSQDNKGTFNGNINIDLSNLFKGNN